MAKRIPKNNSYVCIPAEKLEAIISQCCPPITSVMHSLCLAHEDCTEVDCITCWNLWLKDGDSDALD
jgi:hypothetical protein